MSRRIKIDPTVLHDEIAALKRIRAHQGVTTPDQTLSSTGKTPRVAKQLAALFSDVDDALDLLIDHTTQFLTDVKDGFVEVDDKARAAAKRLGEELGQ